MTIENIELEYLSSGIPAIGGGRFELSRDRLGVYGVGWVGPRVDGFHSLDGEGIRSLILRPDRVREERPDEAHYVGGNSSALQMIPPGGLGRRVLEGQLATYLLAAMLQRVGQSYNQNSGANYRQRWGSDDPAIQLRNRRRWHAYKRSAQRIVNSLVRTALEEAAEPNYLKAARRYPLLSRESMYIAFCQHGLRAVQLAESFPYLAYVVYGRENTEAVTQVAKGRPMREVATTVNVPMSFRRFPAGTVCRVERLAEELAAHPDLIHAYAPPGVHKSRLWISAMDVAQRGGEPFMQWTAKHAPSMGNTRHQVEANMSNIWDWVRACYIASVPPHVCWALGVRWDREDGGRQFVTRPFNADMSLQTAQELSDAWHLAVADNMDGTGKSIEFPPPWYPSDESGGLQIAPVTDSADLHREGYEMHHCVGTYTSRVAVGSLYVYSVREDRSRVATMALGHNGAGKGICIDQLAGPSNAVVSKETRKACRSWLAVSKRKHGDSLMEMFPGQVKFDEMMRFDDFDEGIPF